MSLLYYQILSFVLTAISYLLMARQFGAAAFGSVFAALAVSNFLIDVLDFGRCAWICREISSSKANVHHVFSLLRKVGIRYSVLALPGFIYFIGIKGNSSLIPILIYPATWLIVNYLQGYLIASKQFRKSGILLLIEKSICVSSVIFSILFDFSTILVLSIVAVLPVFIHAFVLIIHLAVPFKSLSELNKKENILKISSSKYREFGIRSVASDFLQLEIPIAKLLLDPISAGVFAMLIKFRNPLSLGFNFIITFTSPLITSKDLRNLSHSYRKLLGIVLFNTTAIIIFSVLLTKYDSTKLFGNDFLILKNVALPLTLTFFFWNVFNVSTSWQVALGEEKSVRKVTVLVVLIHLLVLFGLCQYSSLEIVSWGILIEMMLIGLFIVKNLKRSFQSNLGIELRDLKC